MKFNKFKKNVDQIRDLINESNDYLTLISDKSDGIDYIYHKIHEIKENLNSITEKTNKIFNSIDLLTLKNIDEINHYIVKVAYKVIDQSVSQIVDEKWEDARKSLPSRDFVIALSQRLLAMESSANRWHEDD